MRKPRSKLTIARYAERFAAEVERLQRRYCDAFKQWRDCGHKPCHRARACRGDPRACLARAIETVPRDTQRRVRADMVNAIPANIGGPERAARLSTPDDFYDGAADRYAAQEIKRLRKSGKIADGGENAHTLRLRLADAGR
jgi:hypothetical protein